MRIIRLSKLQIELVEDALERINDGDRLIPAKDYELELDHLKPEKWPSLEGNMLTLHCRHTSNKVLFQLWRISCWNDTTYNDRDISKGRFVAVKKACNQVAEAIYAEMEFLPDPSDHIFQA
jgi:hypothetical protein